MIVFFVVIVANSLLANQTVSAPRTTSAAPTPNDTASTIVRACLFAHASIALTASRAIAGFTTQTTSATSGIVNQMTL